MPDDCGTIDPLLSLYADGLASAEEARRVEGHLPGCAACRESLAWMQATQRALALRPVVSPPADLHARIASAIAASSAAPVSVSTKGRRAFALRPAYAAAASLTALGIVVSYGLLHTQAPPANIPSAVIAPVIVAAVPHVSSSAPVVKPVPGLSVKPHTAHHPTAVLKRARLNPELNPDLMARIQPDESQPESAEVKKPARAATETQRLSLPAPTIALIKPHPSFLKKPTLPKFKPEMMAKAPKAPVLSGETHRPLVVQPEPRRPETVVATVPHDSPASVPVNVGVPSIKPDPSPTVVVVSVHESHVQTADLHGPLGPVKVHLSAMQSFTHTTIGRVDRGAAYASRTIESDGVAYIDGIHSR